MPILLMSATKLLKTASQRLSNFIIGASIGIYCTLKTASMFFINIYFLMLKVSPLVDLMQDFGGYVDGVGEN